MRKLCGGAIAEIIVGFYPCDNVFCGSALRAVVDDAGARVAGGNGASDIRAELAVGHLDIFGIIVRLAGPQYLAVNISVWLNALDIACNIRPEITRRAVGGQLDMLRGIKTEAVRAVVETFLE